MSFTEEKFTWTDELVFKLIREAARRPCIWSKSDEHYLNQHARAAAFEEISNKIDVPADAAREKLRNLRVNFMQVHKKVLKNGCKSRPPKWKFYEALSFLVDEEPKTFLNDSVSPRSNSLSEDEVENVTQSSSPTSMFRVATKLKRECEEFVNPLASPYKLTRAEQHVNETTDEKGPNERFGKYIAATLNGLGDKLIVKRTKARIQLVMSEAMAENAKLELAACDLMTDC